MTKDYIYCYYFRFLFRLVTYEDNEKTRFVNKKLVYKRNLKTSLLNINFLFFFCETNVWKKRKASLEGITKYQDAIVHLFYSYKKYI